ncbi:MAG: 16S rRNA (uracil(1498)-N(3))-methyltransferase [Dehalococcoidia bacterium]|nr:16S rRNA (uracil(1498)-N(3))-methyltransferase [Dehalococcoidia bacterium]
MHRFFVRPNYIAGDSVQFDPALGHRLRNVLRLNKGDLIVLLDGQGNEYVVELVHAPNGGLQGCVVSAAPARGEPRTRITLYQALIKGSNFEFVLQKCTEIGVASFVPVVCSRCVASLASESRAERWRNIVTEAAQQSGRGELPAIRPVLSFEAACRVCGPVAILPWESEQTADIRGVLTRFRQTSDMDKVSILIGPEGGFTDDEVETARKHGIEVVSLGRRVLRAETAGLVTAALALYESGDLERTHLSRT